MTESMQVTRAGPLSGGGRMVLSTGRKDLQPAASFFEILESERSKDRERVDEPLPASQDDPEDRSKEVSDRFQAEPNPLAGAYGVTPPPAPDRPEAESQPGDDTRAQENGSPESKPAAGPTGSEAQAAPTAQAKAAPAPSAQGEAEPPAGETASAAAAGQPGAAPAQADAGAQVTAGKPAADGATASGIPVEDAPFPMQSQAVNAGSHSQHFKIELNITGAAQNPATKDGQPASATQAGAEDARQPDSSQPGKEQAATPPSAQVSVEGPKAPSNPVFEPARLAEAQNKDMVWQISRNIESLVKNRQPSLRLVLYPEELGRIDLRLTTTSAGLGVTVMAEQASTSRLLEAQMAQLRQSLNEAGIQLAHLNIGQRNQSGSGSSQQPARGSHNGRAFRPAAAIRAEEQAPTRASASELIDYKI